MVRCMNSIDHLKRIGTFNLRIILGSRGAAMDQLSKVATLENETRILPGLKGRKVVITAGASGIGYAIARFLRGQGVQIAICNVDAAASKYAKFTMEGCFAFKADVSDETDVKVFFAAVSQDFGGLDALVNNAGIAGPTGKIEQLSVIEWRRCLDICLTGQFLCAHQAVPLIKANGGGCLVNMGSAASKHGYAFRTPCAAAKFGVIGLTESLAKEFGPDNIRINAILPRIVERPRMDNVIRARAAETGVSFKDMADEHMKRVSLRRMVSPGDIASSVDYLLSEFGKNISGQSLAVDGNIETL